MNSPLSMSAILGPFDLPSDAWKLSPAKSKWIHEGHDHLLCGHIVDELALSNLKKSQIDIMDVLIAAWSLGSDEAGLIIDHIDELMANSYL